MNPNEISDRLNVKSAPFTGVYEKRQMRAPYLNCWFNTEDDVLFPHVSIDLSPSHTVWKDFHVTFPIQKLNGFEQTIENLSFSMYYEIRGGTVALVRRTSTQSLRRADNGDMSLDEMTEESKVFALRFVWVAMTTLT
ncbi:hypothetical protein [Oceaniglobus trochenteri]|uniref:hypothetical protein n=1 Tax=Oceaniglobus trochenteri TaxID=2763260 RepID=UPI001CFFA225|nr:hypothetical protein [Oceaniglobus trochenteri]